MIQEVEEDGPSEEEEDEEELDAEEEKDFCQGYTLGEEDRRHLGTEQRMESQLSNGLTPLVGRGGTLEQYL